MKTNNQPAPSREEALFALALDKSPTDRAAFLDRECAGDSSLRQRLEALLAAHEQSDGVLAPKAEPVRPTMKLEPADTPPDEAVGQNLGHYKLLQRIGEGGCGAVYMAQQEEPIRRRVALKVIRLGMDTKQVIARFEVERQALALMDHPNIAKVLDAGATETGRPFFVMELVKGIKITDYCDRNNLSTRDRLDLFIQVCHAIQHAHQKGIIHRDIKPSNILVTLHDGVPVPKVIDFGIAKATDQPLTDKTLFTAFEQFIGTPAYTSPEQAEMSGLDIDTRSDIYALGVLLYELLTGTTPFDAKELMAAGLDEMRRTIREKEPVRPSTRLSTMLAGELTATAQHRQAEPPKLIHLVRGDLDWIVMKCLEKDRTRRYETANGLAHDIERHLNNEPVAARPPSRVYRFQKLVRRNKLVFAAASVVAMALIAGLAVSTWMFARERQARQQAVAAEQAQSRARQEAETARAGEAAQRQKAVQAQADEVQQRQRAETQELAARHRAYASDIRLAQQALAANDLGYAWELLNRQRPGGKSEIRNPKSEMDLRGWEWRYLWAQCQDEAQYTLRQRSDVLCSLAVSSDGKWLASGALWGGLSVWDLESRKEIARLPTGDVLVYAAFSPREPLLAFSCVWQPGEKPFQSHVSHWNAANQQMVTNLPFNGWLVGMAFSEDGQTLVTCTAPEPASEITFWKIPEGRKLKSYPVKIDLVPFEALVNHFAVAPDLSVAAYTTANFMANREDLESRVILVDLANGQERWTTNTLAGKPVWALAFSPDGKILASSEDTPESVIRLWDAASGKEIARTPGHSGGIWDLVFRSDGRILASASGDQTVRLWDLANLANAPPARVLRGHRMGVNRLRWLPDNRTLVSGDFGGFIRVWDTTAASPEGPHLAVKSAAGIGYPWRFGPDSQSVVVVNRQGGVVRWKGTNFREMEPLLEIGANYLRACLSGDGQRVAAGFTNAIQVWDLPGRAPLRRISVSGEYAPCTFLAQGNKLLSWRQPENSLHEWDLTTGQEARSWPAQPGLTRGWDISADERWYFRTASPGPAQLIDLTTGTLTKLDLDLLPNLSDAVLSPDGKHLAACTGGHVKVWETTTQREVVALRGGIGLVFSGDGKRLAVSGSGKGAVTLWSLESFQELLALESPWGFFFAPYFSPDGNVLGAMEALGSLHLWRAPSWAEIEAKEKAEERQP